MPKPKKQPTQARAKFTVQAIYDTFVRIWRRDGPAAATTRAIAAESGFAVGTIYDYFPNRAALYSGYVRHVVELELERIDRDVIAPPAAAMDWRDRLRRLVAITAGMDAGTPYFDAEMLDRVSEIAEPWHRRRVFEELAGKWAQAIAGWRDLPRQPSRATVEALVLAVWGARRLRLHLGPADAPSADLPLADWALELTCVCERALEAGPADR